jgi:hypothetical protein
MRALFDLLNRWSGGQNLHLTIDLHGVGINNTGLSPAVVISEARESAREDLPLAVAPAIRIISARI